MLASYCQGGASFLPSTLRADLRESSKAGRIHQLFLCGQSPFGIRFVQTDNSSRILDPVLSTGDSARSGPLRVVPRRL